MCIYFRVGTVFKSSKIKVGLRVISIQLQRNVPSLLVLLQLLALLGLDHQRLILSLFFIFIIVLFLLILIFRRSFRNFISDKLFSFLPHFFFVLELRLFLLFFPLLLFLFLGTNDQLEMRDQIFGFFLYPGDLL